MKTRISLALVVTLLAGCAGSQPSESPPPQAVRVVAARAETAHGSMPYAGGLEPKLKVDLAFGVTGRVQGIAKGGDGMPLREGDPVKKGQLLAWLDDADLKRQSASTGFASKSANAELQSAKTAALQTAADLERAKELAGSGVIAPVELERAKTADSTAQAQIEIARAQHALKLEQLAIARSVQGDARMTSPIDGVIARRMIDIGENVAGATIAFTVIDTSEMKLVFAVPDARIGAVKLGELVPVHSDALPGIPLVGRVTTIHPVADPALRTFSVELKIDNADGKLRAGMVASAAIGGATKGGATALVPLASVTRAPDGKLAVFVLGDGRVSLRGVTLGDLIGNDVAVKAGVKAGERVVTDGASFLHDGATVEILP